MPVLWGKTPRFKNHENDLLVRSARIINQFYTLHPRDNQMEGVMYDRIVLTLIFVVDSISLFLALHKRRRTVEKAKTTRKVNRILQSLGLK